MKVHRFEDLKKKKLSPDEQKDVDAAVEAELLEMDLRAMRELLGLTQQDVARITKMSQPEISRMERRADHRLSTLRRIVQALGGDLEVVATFGDRRIRLRGAG